MNSVFMDNFRGFRETIVSLRKSNFLIGENSTGKSSYLSLFALFTSPHFWISHDFSSTEFSNLGGFKDIISVTSQTRNRFTVGFLSEYSEDREKQVVQGYTFSLMTFRNEDGMPKLYRYVHFRKGHIIKIQISPKKIRYKIMDCPETFETEDLFKQFTLQVFHDDMTDRKNFKQFSKDIPSRTPIPIIISMIQSMYKLREKDKSPHIFAELPPTVDLTWLAPIRTKPKRTYDGFKIDFTPEGDHTPYLIKKTLDSREKGQKFMELIKHFGESSGLFTRVYAHSFGRDPSAPFEVQIGIHGTSLNINNVGYGVSQVLPVLVEMLTCPKGHWFAIQQPEVHLHPRAQAALGELIYFLVKEYNHNYVIETHSEYLIDRYRFRQKEEGGSSDCQVLFFERTQEGNRIYPLPINEKGQYPEDQPKNFRDFFIREEMRLLEI